jgi:tocopherol O-methyltransferase
MIESNVTIEADAVAAHYDSLDAFYRDIWGEHVHHGYWENGDERPREAVVHLSMTLARWLDLQSGDQVIDVGCGYGGTARLLAGRYAAKVIGYTLSKQQKAYSDSRRCREGKVDVHCQNFLNNQLANESADAVISIECLEHISDKQKAIEEIYRVLKPGKRLAVALWSSTEEPNRMQSYMLRAICREGRLPAIQTGEEYKDLFRRAGFQVIHEREIGKDVKKTWTICAKRLAQRLVSDPNYRRFLKNASNQDRIFALTLLRIRAAFEMKAMEYWIFALEKPQVH